MPRTERLVKIPRSLGVTGGSRVTRASDPAKVPLLSESEGEFRSPRSCVTRDQRPGTRPPVGTDPSTTPVGSGGDLFLDVPASVRTPTDKRRIDKVVEVRTRVRLRTRHHRRPVRSHLTSGGPRPPVLLRSFPTGRVTDVADTSSRRLNHRDGDHRRGAKVSSFTHESVAKVPSLS